MVIKTSVIPMYSVAWVVSDAVQPFDTDQTLEMSRADGNRAQLAGSVPLHQMGRQ